MAKKKRWSSYLKYAAVAALVYAVPMFLYLRNAAFESTWLLYLGNGLFLAFMFLFVIMYNKKKEADANTLSTLAATHMATLLAIGILLIVATVCILFMVPGLFDSGPAEKTMKDTPANMIHGHTNGMLYILYLDLIVGNFTAGSFVGIITSYTAKRNQTRERLPETNLDFSKEN